MARPVKEVFTNPTFILKLIELVLVVSGMGILIGADARYCVNNNGEYILLNLAFTTYVVIILCTIVIMIVDNATTLMVALFLILGALFNLSSGILGFITYSRLSEGGATCIALALFAVITGILMIVDTMLLFLSIGAFVSLMACIVSFLNHSRIREGGDHCFTIALLAFTNVPLMLLDIIVLLRK